MARGSGPTLLLSEDEAVLALPGTKRGAGKPSVLRMRWEGGNAHPAISGRGPLPGRVNHLVGRDPRGWRTGIPTWDSVRYGGVYTGIDLLFHGTAASPGGRGRLEYDFIVAPGADPDQIRLAFDGATHTHIDERGDLILSTAAGPVRHRRPVAFQTIDGTQRAVACDYRLTAPAPGSPDSPGPPATARVTFSVGAYDPSQPLVIDPVLVYGTFIGGRGDAVGLGITVDADGNPYVAGVSGSVYFGTTSGAYDTTLAGFSDAVVMKLAPDGASLVYATYLGGFEYEDCRGLYVDGDGSAYVSGWTASTDFPTTPGAFQTEYAGGASDLFVAKLNPTGTALVYSTLLGGSGRDTGSYSHGLAVDAGGHACVTGDTVSQDFPTTPGAYDRSLDGGGDAIVAQLNPEGTALEFSTFLGGTEGEVGRDVAMDPIGDVYVTGETASDNFPLTPGAFQVRRKGPSDIFVTRLRRDGSGLVYSTFLGGSGSGEETGLAIAVDTGGTAYLTGNTYSSDFPVTPGVVRPRKGDPDAAKVDAFVARVRADGTGLLFSTYLGGNGNEYGRDIVVDGGGRPYVTGHTSSTDFPVTSNAVSTVLRGPEDGFVTTLNNRATAILFSTYIGGTNSDYPYGIALDGKGGILATGVSGSKDFPVTPGAYDLAIDESDGFVVRLLPPPVAPSELKATPFSSTQIELTWLDNSEGEQSFEIERKAGSAAFGPLAAAPANSTSYIDSGIPPLTTYTYRVRAAHPAGPTAYSNQATARTLAVPPAAPTGLTAATVSRTQIRLAWQDNSGNEQAFDVERKTGSTGFAVVRSLGANVIGYDDAGLTGGTTYRYRVRARLNGAEPSAYTNEASATTSPDPPTAPSNLAATVLLPSQINLTWKDNSLTETGFKIERRNGTAAYAEIATTGAGVTNLSNTGLASNVTYFYRVRAYNVSGHSAYSNEVRASTSPPPAAPTNVRAVARPGREIQLTWTDASDNETGFRILRKTSASGLYSQVATAGAGATAYLDRGLAADTLYVYVLRAFNDGGDSDYSNEARASTPPDPPAAPTGLKATPFSQTEIRLEWREGGGAETGFKIERKSAAAGYVQIGTTPENDTTFADTGLAAATRYTYRVRATNAGGDSPYSIESAATTPPHPPVAPASLTAAAVSRSQINLAWVDRSDNETGFEVERKTGTGGTFGRIAVLGGGVVSYASTGLAAGTRYTFRVRAVNAGGASAYTSEATESTLPNPPRPPGALGAAPISPTMIRLTWSDASDNESAFKIERSGPGAVDFSQIGTAAAGATQFDDGGLTPASTYRYRLRAANSGGDSAYSNTAAGVTPPEPPTAPIELAAAVVSQTSIRLTWRDTSDRETLFKIERSGGANAEFVQIGNAGANAVLYTDTGLASNTIYRYRVRAANSGGDSAYSNTASAATFPALVSVILKRSRVRGGKPVEGTVTLAAPAAAVAVVALKGSVPQIVPPASVTVAAGQSSASFVVTTARVRRTVNGTLTATLGSETRSAPLRITRR